MIQEKLLNYIEDNKETLFTMLSDLIKINTENDGSGKESINETPLSEYLRDAFKAFEISSELYSPEDVEGIHSHRDYAETRKVPQRHNITATIKGTKGKKSLMFAGHLDTVPAGDESLWTVDAFKGIIKDGKIWGRGACDDKYSLATMLFLAKAFCDLGIKPKNNILFTGYVDEEFGGGNGALASVLKYPCDLYVNMDCKDFEIWNTASGGQRLAIVIKHPEPLDNCEKIIEGLYLAKKEIDKFGTKRQDELRENPLYHGSYIPDTAFRYMRIESGVEVNAKNVGVIDYAYYTDKDKDFVKTEEDKMLKRIEEKIAPLGLVIDKVNYGSRFFGYGEISKDNENIVLLQESAKDVSGRKLTPVPSCLSDLSLFLANAKNRAFSFGIGRSFAKYGGAHLPDEYIECDKLLEFAKIVGTFVLRWDEEND